MLPDMLFGRLNHGSCCTEGFCFVFGDGKAKGVLKSTEAIRTLEVLDLKLLRQNLEDEQISSMLQNISWQSVELQCLAKYDCIVPFTISTKEILILGGITGTNKTDICRFDVASSELSTRSESVGVKIEVSQKDFCSGGEVGLNQVVFRARDSSSGSKCNFLYSIDSNTLEKLP